MTVDLNFHTPLHVCSKAIRKCWDSTDKSDTCNTNDDIGEKDRALIFRVGIKNKHSSTLEHLVYNFDVQGISRAVLQELARHRIASPSVKSTRYTLKELNNEESFIPNPSRKMKLADIERAGKYLVFTDNQDVNIASIEALENVRCILDTGVSNDKVKYCLPESYKTELSWTINARSLQNFLSLRIDKSALWEIRTLASEIYNSIPEQHKYLFVDIMLKTTTLEIYELDKDLLILKNEDNTSMVKFDKNDWLDVDFRVELYDKLINGDLNASNID